MLLWVILSSFAIYTHQETVRVSVYYESLCPYSKEFLNEQVGPTYGVIGDALELDLVPYGKATQTYHNNEWKFNCQHGVKECYGNKIQACVLAQNYSQKDNVKFVTCVMEAGPEVLNNAQKCCRSTNISWTKLKQCVSSKRGDEYLAYFGEVTQSVYPSLTHVPYILLNGNYTTDFENKARDNFLKAVCAQFTHPPSGCN